MSLEDLQMCIRLAVIDGALEIYPGDSRCQIFTFHDKDGRQVGYANDKGEYVCQI